MISIEVMAHGTDKATGGIRLVPFLGQARGKGERHCVAGERLCRCAGFVAFLQDGMPGPKFSVIDFAQRLSVACLPKVLGRAQARLRDSRLIHLPRTKARPSSTTNNPGNEFGAALRVSGRINFTRGAGNGVRRRHGTNTSRQLYAYVGVLRIGFAGRHRASKMILVSSASRLSRSTRRRPSRRWPAWTRLTTL